MQYKNSSLRDPLGNACCVLRLNNDKSVTAIPFHPANTDYAEYLKWLSSGNVPLPADSE